MFRPYFIIIVAIAVSTFFSCRDVEEFTTDPSAMLDFSTDTVQFDTIFTSIGSATQVFKIYNRNNQAITSNIELAGNTHSNFHLNIDGQATRKLENYEISAHDSLFVFVEVMVDPQDSNSPMIIKDSIMCYTNGNSQKINLIAYGQDVHLYNKSVLQTQTWIADKPYLIYNSILVDSLETLTIEAGAQIHFHNQSALWVLGTLHVQGTAEDPVVFQGDRLESYYDDKPGQWWGRYISGDSIDYLTGCIHFWQGSTNNTIDHAIIKNGTKGIQVDVAPDQSPNLILSNSKIHNMSSIGLLAQTAIMAVYNTEISNCGHYAVALSYGGIYEFYHTTIANYYAWDTRNNEALAMNNYYFYDDTYTAFNFSAYFYNSIIYGNLENELIIDQYIEDGNTFTFKFDHCLMKLNDSFDTSDEDVFANLIKNEDPKFMNTGNHSGTLDFRLDTLSVAKDTGSIEFLDLFPIDMLGNDRKLDGKPDLGAYERIEITEEK